MIYGRINFQFTYVLLDSQTLAATRLTVLRVHQTHLNQRLETLLALIALCIQFVSVYFFNVWLVSH